MSYIKFLSGARVADSPLNAPVKAIRASPKFMLSHPAHLIALGFGSGLSPVAPGTAGTLWAWLSYLLIQQWLTSPQIGWLIAATFLVGWWASTVTARNMGSPDPGSVVCDEIGAFWLVLWVVMPASFAAQLAAFAIFRFFDAVKFGPMSWADKTFKGFGWRGGFGIMLDDFAAGFCTLLVIALWRFW